MINNIIKKNLPNPGFLTTGIPRGYANPFNSDPLTGLSTTGGARRSAKAGIGVSAGNISTAATGLSFLGNMYAGHIASSGTPGRYDRNDSAAGYLSGASTGLSSGAAIGSFLGPVGTAAGAVVGAGIGLIGAGIQDRAMKKQQGMEDMMSSNSFSASQSARSAMNQSKNKAMVKSYSIPGFDQGIGKFYSNRDGLHNANLSPEETVLRPDGRVEVVPGKYNQSNPDTVPASLEDGSGVLPKNSKFKLPYGHSTPADIGKRMDRIQKKNDKVMNKLRVSRIDKNTAAINTKNIEKAKVKLSNFVDAVKSPKTASVANYDEGKAYKTLSMGLGAAGAIGQYLGATPEVFSPILNSYVPMEYSSDLGHRLDDIRMRENISRYNARISGRNTGMSSAVNAAIQHGSNAATRGAFDSDYRQRMSLRNINQQGLSSVQNAKQAELRRIADMNA